jgi:predicted metal-dependent phosphoesterase TrpH
MMRLIKGHGSLLMKVDFHVHTAERSRCATAPQKDQIETAIAAGLDCIAITDHHKLVLPEELARLNREYAPFRILGGVEVYADSEDWLVLNLPDPLLENNNWSYADLHKYVRSKGGLIILAHPYRYRPRVGPDLKRHAPDAIELHSNNIRADVVQRIQDLANHLRIPTLCNSDAHYTSALGKYYNIHAQPLQSEAEIWTAIKNGEFRHSVE